MGRAVYGYFLLPDDASEQQRRKRRNLLLNNYNAKAKKRASNKPRYTVVDLFCGCGGLSTGLELTGRFRTILGVDASAAAIEAFRLNHGSRAQPVQTLQADLGKLDPLLIRAELRAVGILTGELDCLVGGPPCEGFSQNKAQRSEPDDVYDFIGLDSRATRRWTVDPKAHATPRANLERTTRSQRIDKRNNLFRVMLRVTEVVRPKIVLIENVREILTYRNGAIKNEITRTLSNLGYVSEVRILNAADYGVPQMRKRTFILAIRNDIAAGDANKAFPLPTHSAPSRPSALKSLPGKSGKYVSVWEAIGDLPLPRTKTGTRSRPARLRNIAVSKYRRFTRRTGPVLNHEERPLSGSVLERVRYMRPGMRSHDLPDGLRTKKFFYNAYARLEWNKPANTITKSFTYLGSGKFGHPDQNRGLTIREAARLQSFPDNFRFPEMSPKTLAMLVGGAVPPLIAKAFGMRLAAILDDSAVLRTRAR